MAKAYDDPTNSYEWGPNTALTPKLVAHGSQANFRILKGNPVGFAMAEEGYLAPYLSARMENYGQPLEPAMLDTVAVDSYGLGLDAPLMQPVGRRRVLIPDQSSIFRWPDVSVSSGYADPDILDRPGGGR